MILITASIGQKLLFWNGIVVLKARPEGAHLEFFVKLLQSNGLGNMTERMRYGFSGFVFWNGFWPPAR